VPVDTFDAGHYLWATDDTHPETARLFSDVALRVADNKDRDDHIRAGSARNHGDGQMRSRAFRRHQAECHMRRRLKEDRNQHYNDLDCPCWYDPKVMARFKEQPKSCTCYGCRNWRQYEGPTIQERRQEWLE